MKVNKNLISQHKRMAMGDKISPWGATANVPKRRADMPAEPAEFLESKEAMPEEAEYK